MSCPLFFWGHSDCCSRHSNKHFANSRLPPLVVGRLRRDQAKRSQVWKLARQDNRLRHPKRCVTLVSLAKRTASLKLRDVVYGRWSATKVSKSFSRRLPQVDDREQTHLKAPPQFDFKGITYLTTRRCTGSAG